ncbi:hypothetical protein [Cohnella nanjingensis]|uniref:Uncharacterized protein n=1 Tax=Cohnella nanjingensis TaxID=1387779 RepID=A0A7X0RMH3_9BACL|nr:hypothetical protein [Cohnella nanjingensis]MBB6670248.1 hypothetical protein [Cohnella nanjingensis]
MPLSTKSEARDLDADLKRCEDAAGVTIQSFDAIGRLVQFAKAALIGWPAAIRLAKEAEDEIDRLRNELQIAQEQSRSYD